MISKEELEKWAFQLNMDGDCDATDKDIETLITQVLDTMEELETAKRCLPVDKEFEVRGSWIGSVQNYIVHLEKSLGNATAYIEKLREWNAGLAQESFERQERIAELTAGKVGNALLERENHHAEVVGHLVDLIIELKAKLSESSGNAFKGACGGKRFEEAFTPDLSMSPEEFIREFRKLASSSTPGPLYYHAAGEWIPVSERMPEKNQDVLISVNFDSDLVQPLVCSARYTGSTFRRGDATVKPGSGVEQATHWMPLPAAPQEDK